MRIFHSVDLTHRALDYHLQRQNVLASNVANVDTPGFRPMELLREDVGGESPLELGMVRTSAAHLGSGGPGSQSAEEPFRLSVAEEGVVVPGNDGNTVSLEREMAKIAANELRYDGAIAIVRSQLGLLRYAANDGH
jgi:flagellar basal-body rod protein FlgB